MQAAHMSFQEETLRLRRESRNLRQDTARKDQSIRQLRTSIEKLKAENRELKIANKTLERENEKLKEKQKTYEQEIENLKLIVEELRRIVFGKGKSNKSKDAGSEDGGSSADNQTGETSSRKKANRTKSSYRRVTPEEEEVTDTYQHKISHCPDCGTLLNQLKIITRYIEDLQSLSQLYKILKRVEKHLITTGYCPQCKKRKTAATIHPQVTSLGEEVKRFIAYSIVIMRQSFQQVQRFLWDIAKLRVSDGEIALSLVEQGYKLTEERDRLFNKIRGDPGRHYDETGWKVQKEGQGNYTWVTTGTKGKEAVFLMGQSRGKGNAQQLRGAVDNQVGISDDYPAYQNLFAKHQLCWSHPARKLKDLKDSISLSKSRRKICANVYKKFSKLYQELEFTLSTDYNKKKWLTKRKQYLERLRTISQTSSSEPLKLQEIKKGLQRNGKKYFTCLQEPGIPADNNKAERCLRHIVLKRKMSYGSKSQKGADTMAILCTTLLSKWWNKPDNFFAAYNQMLT